MRLLIKLSSSGNNSLPVLPINYQYPVSSCLYKIISKGDSEYATFLHDIGYKGFESKKSFKLFTFSDISVPFKINGDRLICLKPEIQLTVCFHLPYSAETFVKGLFLNQLVEIADKKSKAVFSITSVEILPDPLSGINPEDIANVLLSPISPVVCLMPRESGNNEYLHPEKDGFRDSLLYNWKEKIRALYNVSEVSEPISVEVIQNKYPPKSRLITIKADTPQETKIRGFTNFNLNVKAKKKYIDLLLNCGSGVYNAQGFGCLEVKKK